MAKYQLTSPQGQRFEVEAPDHAQEHEVLDYFQKQVGLLEPAAYGSKDDVAAEARKRQSGPQKYGLSDLAAHSATLGLEDYVAGVGRGGTNYLLKSLRGEDTSFPDEYARERDIREAQRKLAREEQGGLGTAAELAGGVGGLGFNSAAIKGAATLPQAKTWGETAKNFLLTTPEAIKQGGIYGGIYGFNTEHGDLVDKAKSTIASGIEGAVTAPFFKLAIEGGLGGVAKVRQGFTDRKNARLNERAEHAENVRRDFDEAGVQPFIPAEAGPIPQAITRGIQNSPIVGDNVSNAARETMLSLRGRLGDAINNTGGNITPGEAGSRIRQFAREQLLSREESRGDRNQPYVPVEDLPPQELQRLSGLPPAEPPQVPPVEPQPVQRLSPEEYLKGVGDAVPPVAPKPTVDVSGHYQQPTARDVPLPPEMVTRMQKAAAERADLTSQVTAARQHIQDMDAAAIAPLKEFGVANMEHGFWGPAEKGQSIWNFQMNDGSRVTLDTAGHVMRIEQSGMPIQANVPEPQLQAMHKAIEWGNFKGAQEQGLAKLEAQLRDANYAFARHNIEKFNYRRDNLPALEAQRRQDAMRAADEAAQAEASVATQKARQEAMDRERPNAIQNAEADYQRRIEAEQERAVDETVRLQREADAAHQAASRQPFELGGTDAPIQRQLDAAYAQVRNEAPRGPSSQRNILGDPLQPNTNTTTLLDSVAREARGSAAIRSYREGQLFDEAGNLHQGLSDYLRPRLGEDIMGRLLNYAEARKGGEFPPGLPGLQRLRSAVRAAARDPGELDGPLLQRLSGAIDSDMRNIARSNGPRGETFMRRLDQVDAAFERYHNDLRAPLRRILDPATDTGSIYNEVARSVRNGSSNIDTLRRLYGLVDAKGNETLNRSSLTGMLLTDMNRDGVQGFLRAYRDLSPDARAIMFHGPTEALGTRLDALTRVGGRMERWARAAERDDLGVREMVNIHNVTLGLLGFASLPAFITTALGAKSAGKLFTSKWYGDWLRRVPMEAGPTSPEWQHHMQRLSGYTAELLDTDKKGLKLLNDMIGISPARGEPQEKDDGR